MPKFYHSEAHRLQKTNQSSATSQRSHSIPYQHQNPSTSECKQSKFRWLRKKLRFTERKTKNAEDYHFLFFSSNQNIRKKNKVSPSPIKTTTLLELSEGSSDPSDRVFFFHQAVAEAQYLKYFTAKNQILLFPYRQLIRQRFLWLGKLQAQPNGTKVFLSKKVFVRKYIPENSLLLLLLLLASKNKETPQTKIDL